MFRLHYQYHIDIRNVFSQRSYPIQPYTPIHFTLSIIISVKNSSVFEFYYARASEKDHLGLIKDDFETDDYKTGLGQRLHSLTLLSHQKFCVVQPWQGFKCVNGSIDTLEQFVSYSSAQRLQGSDSS